MAELESPSLPHWEPTGVLGSAWERFKKDWIVLVAAFVIGYLMTAIPANILSLILLKGKSPAELLSMDLGRLRFNHAALTRPVLARYGIIYTFNFLAGHLVSAGTITLNLRAARGQDVRLSHFFLGMSRFLPCVAAGFVTFLVILLGIPFCVVPGIILALALWPATYFAVDRGLGPIAAVEAAWLATRGQKVRVFILGVLFFFMILAGLLACCVGLLVAVPLVSLTIAIVFDRLAGTPPQNPLGGAGAGLPAAS